MLNRRTFAALIAGTFAVATKLARKP